MKRITFLSLLLALSTLLCSAQEEEEVVYTYDELCQYLRDHQGGYTVSVTLGADIDQEDMQNGRELLANVSDVTLDLNGHKLSRKARTIDLCLFKVIDGGTLTVKDSQGGGSVYFDNTDYVHKDSWLFSCHKSTLNIYGGKFIDDPLDAGRALIDVIESNVNIYGGEFVSDRNAILSLESSTKYLSKAHSNAVIYGGTFQSGKSYSIYARDNLEGGYSTLMVLGGRFYNNCQNDWDCFVYFNGRVNAYIGGGVMREQRNQNGIYYGSYSVRSQEEHDGKTYMAFTPIPVVYCEGYGLSRYDCLLADAEYDFHHNLLGEQVSQEIPEITVRASRMEYPLQLSCSGMNYTWFWEKDDGDYGEIDEPTTSLLPDRVEGPCTLCYAGRVELGGGRYHTGWVRVIYDYVDYGLSVAGEPVESGNKDDVLEDGRVSYDPASKTLTLNSAQIDAGDQTGIFNRDVSGLTIRLKGDNTITTRGQSLYLQGQGGGTTITSDGTGELYMDEYSSGDGYNQGIYVRFAPLVIENCGVVLSGAYGGIIGLGGDNGLVVRNASLTVSSGCSMPSISNLESIELENCHIVAPEGARVGQYQSGSSTYWGVLGEDGEPTSETVRIEPGPALLKGDINGDGIVNVTDVTALINTILGTASYSQDVCDINGDGVMNVTDVTALINLILGES